jgi:hypothetical protein
MLDARHGTMELVETERMEANAKSMKTPGMMLGIYISKILATRVYFS